MKNGLVVMQAENGTFKYKSNAANNKWKETTKFAGEEGSVLQWTGGNLYNKKNAGQKQVAPLEYHFEVDDPGTYYLTIRAIKPAGSKWDLGNDFFVQFENGSHQKIFFPGAAPGKFRWADKYDPGHGKKKEIATFKVTDKMIKDNDGVFTLTVSARSDTAGFDEIHIKKGSQSRNEKAPTSKLVKGDGNSGGNDNPPPPPQDDEPVDPPANNKAPVAKDDTASTGHDKTVSVNVLKNDKDPDGSKLTLVDVDYDGKSSKVTISGNNIKVNPLIKYTEERVEEIEYTVKDADGAIDKATLKVTVGGKDDGPPPPPPPPPADDDVPPNDDGGNDDAPVAKDDTAKTGQNKTILVDVLANDTGKGLKIVDIDYDGGTSSVSVAGNKIKVNPLKKYDDDRVEVITYTVQDSSGAKSKAVLRVDIGNPDDSTVEPIDPPVDQPDQPSDSLLDLFIVDADADEVISGLSDGTKISASALSDEISFFATTDDDDAFAFVELSFEGITRKEKVEPYALFGDKNGDFRGGLDLDKGNYSIVAKGYDDDKNLIETVDIDFAIV